MILWHPSAKKVIIPQAPQNLAMVGGGRGVVWHTTEGGTIEGAESAYRAAGVCPHFTIAMVNGRRVLHQHLPLSRAASALQHPPGTLPTNTANKWQVEVVGFADESGSWSKQYYHYLHLLAKFFNRHCGVPMTSDVLWRNPKRMGQTTFYNYKGHCGHVHAASQPDNHTDPGRGFHIGYVLSDAPGY